MNMDMDRDKQHMQNPDNWTHWPMCPLVHTTQRDATGIKRTAILVTVGVGGYAIIEDANIFETKLKDAKAKDTTIDEVLAAGWRVD